MSRLRSFRLFLSLSALICALMPFQNCGSPLKGYKSDTQFGGNGSGYDGKVFVHLDKNVSCVDGKPYDSAIAQRGDGFYLVRDNCMDLLAAQQMKVAVQSDPATPNVLSYQGRIYLEYLTIGKVQFNSAGEVLMNGAKFDDFDHDLKFLGPFIGKYDSTGRRRWSITNEWFVNGEVQSVLLKDGGVLVASTHTSGSNDTRLTWLARLDAQGRPLWSRKVLNAKFQIATLAEDADGRLYAGGALYDSQAVSAQAFLLRMDKDGHLLTAQTLPAQGLVSVLQFQQGAAYVSGANGASFNSMSAFYMKIDSASGAVIWSRTFPGLSARLSFSAAGDPLLTGFYTAPVPNVAAVEVHSLFLKLSAVDGSVVLSRKFSTPAAEQKFYEPLQAASDGGLYAVLLDDPAAMRIAKLDENLNLMWSARAVYQVDVTFSGLIAAPDGRFWQNLRVASKIAPYSGNLYSPIRLDNWPAACASCTDDQWPSLVDAPIPNSQTGPSLQDLSIVIDNLTDLPPFKIFSAELPFF